MFIIVYRLVHNLYYCICIKFQFLFNVNVNVHNVSSQFFIFFVHKIFCTLAYGYMGTCCSLSEDRSSTWQGSRQLLVMLLLLYVKEIEKQGWDWKNLFTRVNIWFYAHNLKFQSLADSPYPPPFLQAFVKQLPNCCVFDVGFFTLAATNFSTVPRSFSNLLFYSSSVVFSISSVALALPLVLDAWLHGISSLHWKFDVVL